MSKQRRDKEGDVNPNVVDLTNKDIDKAVAEAQTSTVASPAGLSKLTDDAMTVLGIFVKHRNRALAVQETETIMTAMQVEITGDVEDAYSELEANKLIVECPSEVHEDKQSRYRIV